MLVNDGNWPSPDAHIGIRDAGKDFCPVIISSSMVYPGYTGRLKMVARRHRAFHLHHMQSLAPDRAKVKSLGQNSSSGARLFPLNDGSSTMTPTRTGGSGVAADADRDHRPERRGHPSEHGDRGRGLREGQEDREQGEGEEGREEGVGIGGRSGCAPARLKANDACSSSPRRGVCSAAGRAR